MAKKITSKRKAAKKAAPKKAAKKSVRKIAAKKKAVKKATRKTAVKKASAKKATRSIKSKAKTNKRKSPSKQSSRKGKTIDLEKLLGEDVQTKVAAVERKINSIDQVINEVPTPEVHLTKQIELEEEYGVSEDGTLDVPGVHTRHKNRNEDKGRDRASSGNGRKSTTRNRPAVAGNENPQDSNNGINSGAPNRTLNGHSPHYFVLVLSKKQAKLFRADESSIRHVQIDEMPNGIDDVVHLEEKNDKNLFRTGSSGAGGGANYHGMGSGVPDEKENIALYLKEVDRTLWTSILNKENVPLVIGGVEYLTAIFKDLTQYNHVWNEVLTGSFENADQKQIYDQSLKLVAPYFEERTEKALALFGNQSATNLVSKNPSEIVSAAHFKRVSHLFVPEDSHLWGNFDEAANDVDIHMNRKDGDEDLRDKVIKETLANGGEVHIVSREKMPDNSAMAAIMRFELN